jgi:glutamate synthase (ferredoxin)
MARTLYDPVFDHDACGVGFVARVTGEPEHEIVRLAVRALDSLAHRGAVASDGKSGDGAGILTQVPRRFFAREAARLGFSVDEGVPIGVGMLFLPPGDTADEGRVEEALRAQGVAVLGWREVPIEPEALGSIARASLPWIRQVLVAPPEGATEESFEHRLYLARKAFERENDGGYVCSLSCRTLVYKALCVGGELDHLYTDLRDPLFESAVAIFHQRFSTNTLPSWPMAQPFRLLAHNGEINTLDANQAWMRAREADLPREVCPVLARGGSDSAALDAAAELLVRGGRRPEHALAMLVPSAWEETGEELPEEARAFFRYHAPVMEPWDGPAALAFSDGRFVGAALDRNGLRPCRFKITADGLVVAGSEAGVLALDDDVVVAKGRLGPGQVIGIDLRSQRLMMDAELKAQLAREHPYAEWTRIRTLEAAEGDAPVADAAEMQALQHLHGVTREDLTMVLEIMAGEGKEPIWSMGDDTPVAPLARAPRPVYSFFAQRFAQVTNPAIDPLRETRVMSLRTWLGARPEPFVQGPHAPLVELTSPVLTPALAAAVRREPMLRTEEVPCLLRRGERLPDALERIAAAAAESVRGGALCVLLSDRGARADAAPVPMALALGAVHQRLLAAGLRGRACLVAEAGDCIDVHQLAVLVGCGADAVAPWLAFASGAVPQGKGADTGISVAERERNLIASLETGLLKVMSKMGISTVASYRGGHLFEILGLADEVVERCFAGTPSRIAGLGWAELEADILRRHALAWGEEATELSDPGRLRYRRGDESEHHAWEPAAVRALQRAVGSARRADGGDPGAWAEFRRGTADFDRDLRDLLDTVTAAEPLPLEEVESASSIVKRFVTSAMSLGALSPEAHQALTIAMNRLGARSNSGEGGEDPAVYQPDPGGDRLDNKVKQVASGRFGVTTEYLSRAEEIEIKISQGSKPGEGGQLPGHKVTALIARLRHARPGMSLISPPPHHDIYSIEDLAQLIHDLKQTNPRARIGVKLVSIAGVGTVAAGVAKAYADYVMISGNAGGTGASPLSSIKHAGIPWELGLAETQQVLVHHGLRDRIRVRVDGGFRTGRDVVVATLLGAEEFGFGTAALVALGCDMARQCHKDTCPAGIATQRPELRAKFRGEPEHVIRYLMGVAEDVRAHLALLGFARLEDAVGRSDLLRQVRATAGLDLSRMLARVEGGGALRSRQPRNDRPDDLADCTHNSLLTLGDVTAGPGDVSPEPRPIRTCDRAVGARLSGEIAYRFGNRAPYDEPVELHFRGSAGQSFGAFSTHGVRLVLIGEANDYVGKGLSGGELVLRPAGRARFESDRNVILGNVALYGATAGRLFAAGLGGERFAVRNSGATAVVEGVGDHCCEYMTGGTVVVLGEVGWNFGAGMMGGEAYVLDEEGVLERRLHPAHGGWIAPTEGELMRVRALVEAHLAWTGSVRAAAVLAAWDEMAPLFRRLAPGTVALPVAERAQEAAARGATV